MGPRNEAIKELFTRTLLLLLPVCGLCGTKLAVIGLWQYFIRSTAYIRTCMLKVFHVTCYSLSIWKWGGAASGLTVSITICFITLQVKTTAPVKYKVRPNFALIDAKSVAKVHVLLVPGQYYHGPMLLVNS